MSKRKLIKPSFWDDRLKVYLMPRKDPLGFGDVLVRLECWDGSFIETWIDPFELQKSLIQ